MGQRARKRKRSSRPAAAAAPAPPPAAPGGERDGARAPADGPGQPAPARGRQSRSAAKDAAARAGLVPLGEGERPLAVTIAAVLALLLAVGNLAAYLAGVKVQGRSPALPSLLAYTGLLLVAAWGLWRARYWAVLGMQAVLAILIILFGILIVTASNVPSVFVALAVIVPAGALFWFLVKAMARIQMPRRR